MRAGREAADAVQCSYELLEPLHRLWLGYISELLQITLRDSVASSTALEEMQDYPVRDTAGGAGPSSTKAPVKVSAQHVNAPSVQQTWQAKLVKADFHGCKLSGEERGGFGSCEI